MRGLFQTITHRKTPAVAKLLRLLKSLNERNDACDGRHLESRQAGGDFVCACGGSREAASATRDENRTCGDARSVCDRRALAADRQGDEAVRAVDGSAQAVRG